jgi:hypothetical protein
LVPPVFASREELWEGAGIFELVLCNISVEGGYHTQRLQKAEYILEHVIKDGNGEGQAGEARQRLHSSGV